MTADLTLQQRADRLPGYDPGHLPVEIARRLILDACTGVPAAEPVPLAPALDRVLAADLLSPIDVPAHDNAAMDGFACASSALNPNGPTTLPLAGSPDAGRPCEGFVPAGHALRITTGAVLPAGADTVVMQEDCQAGNGRVTLPAGVIAGSHCRARGEDLRAGHPALPAGRRLTAADLGLAASLGITMLTVRRRLRVACLSTGDELRAPGETLAAGQIYDSNRFALGALAARLGVEVIDHGIVADRRDRLEDALQQASREADVVLSSGGMSVGEADFTRPVTAAMGEVLFWQMAMRPGRPLAFGRLGGATYFGLPGNPVAAMVSFCMFVRPALLRLMGARCDEPLLLSARSADTLRKKPGRTEFQRATLRRAADGSLEARLTGDQGSGLLSSMSRADCLLVLHPDQQTVAAGETVDVLMLHGIV